MQYLVFGALESPSGFGQVYLIIVHCVLIMEKNVFDYIISKVHVT